MESLKLIFKPILFVLVIAFLTSGCSSLGPSAGQDPGFRQKVAPAHLAQPLPVEIAKDIERITEEGLLVYTDNPSYSKAFGVLDSLTNNNNNLNASNSLVEERLQENLENSTFGTMDSLTDENKKISNAKKTSSVHKENDFLTESDLILKSEGPLAQASSNQNRGPLNFKSIMKGSGLPELTGGKTITYLVKLGDTLMKIAFEKYGHYLRWKDIYKINHNKMQSPERMQVGTELTIKNVKYVYIQRDGKPYLIRKMDTLKSISTKLYGTPDRWQDIWKNNPQLIRNPKKIYAGFTLYYPSSDKSDLDSRQPTSNVNIKETSK